MTIRPPGFDAPEAPYQQLEDDVESFISLCRWADDNKAYVVLIDVAAPTEPDDTQGFQSDTKACAGVWPWGLPPDDRGGAAKPPAPLALRATSDTPAQQSWAPTAPAETATASAGITAHQQHGNWTFAQYQFRITA